jgi:hypothetical protein
MLSCRKVERYCIVKLNDKTRISTLQGADSHAFNEVSLEEK